MIRTLLRQDAAFENPWSMVLAPLAVGLLLRLMALAEELPSVLTDPATNGGRGFLIGGLWTFLLAVVLGSKIWVRCPRLHHGLPISARTAWLVRAAAIQGVCTVVIVLFTAATAIRFDGYRPMFRGDVWFGAFRMLTVLWLFILLLQSPHPHLRRLPNGPGLVVYAGFVWLVLNVLVQFAPFNLWTPAVSLVLCGLLAGRIWRLTPPIHELETESPRQAAPVAKVPTTGDTAALQLRPSPSRLLLHRTIFFQMHRHWANLLYIPLMFIYGLVIAPQYAHGDAGLIKLAYGILFGLSTLVQAILRMHPLDPLPIPRRTLFAHAVAPVLIVTLLGAAGGMLIVDRWSQPPSLLHLSDNEYRTPYEFLEIAPVETVPTVARSGGHVFTPAVHGLRPWSDQVLFDPYESPDDSPALTRRQMGRALSAVYGLEPTDSRLAPVDASLDSIPLVDPYRGAHSALRDRTFGALGCLTVLLTTLTAWALLGLYNARRTRRSVRIRGFGLLGAPLLILPVLLVVDAGGGAKMWVSAAAALVMLRRFAAWAPRDAAAWAGLVATLAVAGYFVVERRFAGIEASQDLMKKQRAENV